MRKLTIIVVILTIALFSAVAVASDGQLNLNDVESWKRLNHEHPVKGMCKYTLIYPYSNDIKIVQVFVVQNTLIAYRYLKDGEVYIMRGISETEYKRGSINLKNEQDIIRELKSYARTSPAFMNLPTL